MRLCAKIFISLCPNKFAFSLTYSYLCRPKQVGQ